jgi:hypothetical protein
MKPSFTSKWILFILPLFYLLLSILYLVNVKHFFTYNSDPPYIYLMEGTNLASGHFRVGNIEPPGTPVDCFAAIVIFTKHLFSGDTEVYKDVLLHPESYLFTCSILLMILLVAVTLWSGIYVFRHTGNLAWGLLFQASPLFYSDTIRMTVSLSAESLITIFGVFFMAYLYVNTVAKNPVQEKTTTNKNSIIFGLFTALIITTKIYCVPLIFLVLFLLKGRKQQIIYLASTGLFSLALLFPLYNQFRNWAGTMKAMLMHSGPYGQGGEGIINTTQYGKDIIEIFTTHFIFTAVFILVLAAFLITLWRRKQLAEKAFLFPILGILISFMLFTLILAKQYKFNYPSPLTHQVITIIKFYYFIPVFICFPLAIGVSYKIFSHQASFKFLRIHKQKIFYAVFIIFIAWGGQQAYAACADISSQNEVSDKTSQLIDNKKYTPLIIVTNGYKVRMEEAYFLGISFSGKWDMGKYFDFVKTIYPNSYLYTTWNDELMFWDKQTDISTILIKNHRALVYFSGTDSTSEKTIVNRICIIPTEKGGLHFNKIYSSDNKYESIYLVKADSLR